MLVTENDAEADGESETEQTSMSVSTDLADELHDCKERGDSYGSGIWRLIAVADEREYRYG